MEKFVKSINLDNLGFTKRNIYENKNEFMDTFPSFVASFLCFSFLVPLFFVSLFFLPSLPFCYPYSSPRPSSLFLSFVLFRCCAKVQRRGLPVVDDQRGFPFSTPCCCATIATPPPSSSLPSSFLFFHVLGSTGMIILNEKIQYELYERL